MSWRFRKVFSGGPFRWTLSRGGIGWSWGIPGLRYGVSATGRRYVSCGIPGFGLYWVKYLDETHSGGLGSIGSEATAGAATDRADPVTRQVWRRLPRR